MIRVLLVDDDPLVHVGLRQVLTAAGDIEVVGEIFDGDEVLDAVWRLHPDVICLDIRMRRQDGVTTMRQLRELPDRPRVILLTTWDESGLATRGLEAGADGFILKAESSPQELQAAVRQVHAGGGVVTPSRLPEVLDPVLAIHRERSAARATLQRLTEREREVCIAIAAGGSNADAAARLFMAESTTKAHLQSAQRKLGGLDRTGIIVLVTQAGWAPSP